MFSRFGISSRVQRIALSIIALFVAVAIGMLQGEPNEAQNASAVQPRPQAAKPAAAQPAKPEPSQGVVQARSTAQKPSNREQAVRQAISWLKGQEGGKHRGHTIARHVGKSDRDLQDRIDRDGKSVASGFYDMETAAVAIVRTINHKPNKARVRSWLDDDASRRRLALRRLFDKPIGRIVYRNGDRRHGKTAVAVLTKWREKGRVSYRLLTAYVER